MNLWFFLNNFKISDVFETFDVFYIFDDLEFFDSKISIVSIDDGSRFIDSVGVANKENKLLDKLKLKVIKNRNCRNILGITFIQEIGCTKKPNYEASP